MTVIVYSTNHCPECNILKRFLHDYGIAYETRNCSSNPQYLQEVNDFGFIGVPLTVIDGHPIQGFKPEAIMRALGKQA